MYNMNFDIFKQKRDEHVAWVFANGFNDGDCEKNGEFKVLELLRELFCIFVDIGSNKGVFINKALSVNSSAFVLAFEPNPYLTSLLSAKVKSGKVVQVALSNKKGRANFNVYLADDTTSCLYNRSDLMPGFTKKVESIDIELDMLNSYYDLISMHSQTGGVFVKIDAEGAEFDIMDGGRLTLSSLPQVFLMFEYSTAWRLGGHTLKKAFHLLDEMQFKIFRVTPFGLESFRFYTPEMDGDHYCNYLAVKGFDLDSFGRSTLIRSVTHNWNQFHLFP